MRVRCPDSPDTNDVIGCGEVFDAEPDDEGYYDCPRCGLFFDATHPHSAPQPAQSPTTNGAK